MLNDVFISNFIALWDIN